MTFTVADNDNVLLSLDVPKMEQGKEQEEVPKLYPSLSHHYLCWILDQCQCRRPPLSS